MASEELGLREWVNLIVFAIEFYLRHKDNIDANASGPVKSAMETLASAVDAIRSLNPPGPL